MKRSAGASSLAAWVTGAALLLAGVPAAADPAAQLGGDVARLQERLRDLDARLALVEKQYTDNSTIIGISSFDQKLGEGLIFLALAESSRDLRNYERAAILLFDIVEDPANRARSTYDEAVNALAESLFQLRFRYGARTYYRLLAERRNPRFLENAVVRLIELAGLLDNYDGLDAYYAQYEQLARGNIRPAVRYARGKLLLRRQRGDEAERELAQVPPGDPYFVRALYLRGVILVKAGRTEEAIARFTECARAQPVGAEDAVARDLANMARGRLHYELGQLAESADAYQDIGTESPQFSEMLYEVAWTFVKRGQNFQDNPERANAEFNKALQALDLLLISNTSKRLESDVRILRGNLLTRLGRHDEAEAAFEDIVGAYKPTLDQLARMMADTSNAEAVLQELMRRNQRSAGVDSLLPPLARAWAAGDDSVADAVHVYADIEEAGVQVSETRELADRLLKVIDAPNRMDLFPALQEGRSRALSLENSLLAALGQAADMESRALGAAAQAPAAQEYRTARATREELQRKMIAMPSTEADMTARLERFRGRLRELDRRVFRQQLEVDRVEATVAAIQAHVAERKAANTLPPAEEEYWRAELLQISGALDQMRQLEKELRGAMRQERDSLTVANVQGSQEGVIRAQFREAVSREAEAAKPLGAGADPLLGGRLPAVQQSRAQAEKMLARLDGFNRALRAKVDAQAAEMRGVVMLERTRVDEYERMAGAYQGEAHEMASVLTSNALKGVRDQFYDVVLRADVGLIDLAWQGKQEKTDEVSRLVRAQKADIIKIDAEFEEVLRDIE